jgi:hypothetical protein
MDEPFIVKLKGGDFITIPYIFHMNDIVSGWNPADCEQALKDEFDQLYVSLHDRISGHANRVRVLDRFPTYAKSRPGVWFARKAEIAAYALKDCAYTPVYDRGPPTVTGLPGSTTACGFARTGSPCANC